MKSSPNRLWLVAAALLLIAVVVVFLQNGSDTTTAQNISAEPAVSGSTSSARDERSSRPAPTETDRLLQAEGARTDVGLSTFPIKEYKHVAPPAGKASGAPAGEAFIHVPSVGRRVALEANQIGEYPTVETRLNDTVGVRLSLDNVKLGTPVRVVIMDGGTFPATQGASQLLKATNWGGTAFEFTTSGNIGFHRVLVQAVGQPARILNFSAHDADTWPAPSTALNN